MASNALAQIAAVTTMNLQNLSSRMTASVVSLIGIAGVVTVLIGVLSIGEGFRAVLDQSGAEDVAIVHLATGWNAGQLKVGSFARSERMAKWNEGIRLEARPDAPAGFASRAALASRS